MKSHLNIFVMVIVASVIIPGAFAAEDLVKTASGLSIAVPTTGTAIMGSNESMHQYQGYLDDSANNLVAFFMQVMALLGMSNTNATLNMQNTLQKGIHHGTTTTSTTSSPNSEPEPGSIMIRTKPGGVQVFVDGQYKGSTPEDSSKVLMINGIPIGSHTLDLRKPGYTYAQEIIPVSNGNWVVLFEELQTAPA